MKNQLTLALLALTLFATIGRADELEFPPPVQPAVELFTGSSPEENWKRYLALSNGPYRNLPQGKAERELAFHRIQLNLLGHAVGFYQQYPEAPERWAAVNHMYHCTEALVQEDGSLKTAVSGEWPAAVWAAWRKQLQALSQQGLTAPDTPSDVRFSFESRQPGGLWDKAAAARQAFAEKQPVDPTDLRAEIERLAQKYPEEETLALMIGSYMGWRGKAGATADELKREWQELAGHPHAKIRDRAEREVSKMEAFSKPLEIAFTAVDGRKVDLKDLRGKVVLIDFWATWCGPCVKEIPNVKKVYADYHAKGFEIIGIALEHPTLAPTDTPEQIAAKHEKVKQLLKEFTAKNEMPWPQYYDEKARKNDIAFRYGVQAIPAMFLLDQDGKVVNTNARGEVLEREVKRLLNL